MCLLINTVHLGFHHLLKICYSIMARSIVDNFFILFIIGLRVNYVIDLLRVGHPRLVKVFSIV